MSEYQGWTLEEHMQIDHINIGDHMNNHLIRGMQQTGFHKWGFIIYRCTYSDDEAWLRFVKYIYDKTIEGLEFAGQRFLLEKYLNFQFIEDRDQLDGALKSTVRALFAERAERDRQVDQGGPGIATYIARMIPRFNYCLYVDEACLNTLLAHEQWDSKSKEGRLRLGEPIPVVCAIIDTDCEPGGEGKDGYELVEGCTRYFPGWMYCQIDLLSALYNRLHFEELTEGYKTYERPPGIPNSGGQRMPL